MLRLARAQSKGWNRIKNAGFGLVPTALVSWDPDRPEISNELASELERDTWFRSVSYTILKRVEFKNLR